jgi:hypothetical protein
MKQPKDYEIPEAERREEEDFMVVWLVAFMIGFGVGTIFGLML